MITRDSMKLSAARMLRVSHRSSLMSSFATSYLVMSHALTMFSASLMVRLLMSSNMERSSTSAVAVFLLKEVLLVCLTQMCKSFYVHVLRRVDSVVDDKSSYWVGGCVGMLGK